MLIIRHAQMATLDEGVRDAFADSLVPKLAKIPRAPGAPDGDGYLRTCARTAARVHGRWGITSRIDVFRLAEVHVRLGPAFEARPPAPWVAEILARPSLDGPARLAWLEYQSRYGAPLT